MKFFHIADVHLGATPDKGFPWSYDRGREIWESFQNVIRQAGRENVGLFLIAGDLFHRQPLLKELKEVNALFASIPNTMTEAGKSGKVFKMLSGRPAEKMSVCFSLREIYSTDSLC